MSYRKVVLCLVVLSPLFVQAEEWNSRFARARSLAFKRAGPEPMITLTHHIVPARTIPAPSTPSQLERKPRRSSRKRTKRANNESKRVLPSPRTDEILVKARRARENGQLEQALKLYKLAQRASPQSQEAREVIGQIEREMN